MIIYFKEKDGVERYNGYSDKDIFPNRKSKEVSSSKLEDIVPNSVEEGWKDSRQKFKLDNSGDIVFDESYNPKGGV